MSPDALTDISIHIERSFDSPRETVFRAWTERDQLVQWWGPDGYTVPSCEMDVRVAGGFRVCMMEPDGTEHWVVGKYLEIKPPERLAFTWAWETDGVAGPETEVRIDFVEDGEGTKLVVTHSGFESEESSIGHNQGWISSFDCLQRHLA